MKHLLPLIIWISFLCNANAQNSFNIVKTTAGKVSGSMSSDGTVHIFKGVPFAAPPVGDLRWKAPQAVKTWAGIKPCTEFSASPMQAKPVPFMVYTEEFLIKKEPISEDCLYLNIWTAAKAQGEKRPVLVYIYGGGFVSGGTSVPVYDGEAMAKRGIIFITINYRVGIFGFFAHPELTSESPDHTSGNYGLMDQLAALQWVQKNISAFGGDPAKVTIAGQSAGSISVNYLVASPLCKGLFKQAIAESGANFLPGGFNGTTLAQAEENGLKTAKALNAVSLVGLRKLPAEELLKYNNGRPVIDGYVIPEMVADIFAKGKENKVPLLTGWNEDDALVGPPKTAEAFKAEAKQKYGSSYAEFIKYYPANDDAEAAASQIKISRDITFGVQNYTWANQNKAPVYLYRFARRLPATPAYTKYGAFHTGEVAYAYDNLKFLNRPFEAADRQLANTMAAYWVNFIKTGNPNGRGLPEWPAFDAQTNQITLLNEKPASEQLPDKAALDFMAKQTNLR